MLLGLFTFRTRWIVLLSLILGMTGCRKDNPIAEDHFVAGDLIIGVTNHADLKTVFDTLNSLDFKIHTMTGFDYNCNLPPDSVNYLLNLLNQKPYINNADWDAYAYYSQSENTIMVDCILHDMTPAYQTDFLNTIQSLSLIDRFSDTKDIVLRIPVGSEQYWLKEMKKYSFVKWTELNWIIRIDPL